MSDKWKCILTGLVIVGVLGSCTYLGIQEDNRVAAQRAAFLHAAEAKCHPYVLEHYYLDGQTIRAICYTADGGLELK